MPTGTLWVSSVTPASLGNHAPLSLQPVHPVLLNGGEAIPIPHPQLPSSWSQLAAPCFLSSSTGSYSQGLVLWPSWKMNVPCCPESGPCPSHVGPFLCSCNHPWGRSLRHQRQCALSAGWAGGARQHLSQQCAHEAAMTDWPRAGTFPISTGRMALF